MPIQNTVINNQSFVGEGAVWKVYSCNVPDIPYTSPVILKIPRGFAESSVEINIKNYGRIKTLGLPTLDFLQKVYIQEGPALIGQNLNSGNNEIFVSPNTLITDDERKAENLRNLFFETQTIRPDSLAEIFRYRNKLSGLINFQPFISQVKNDLHLASERHIIIELDSYFFGSSKNDPQSALSYCIADFDHIYHCPERKYSELLECNFSEFKRAIRRFLEVFCETNRHQIDNLKIIENEF